MEMTQMGYQMGYDGWEVEIAYHCPKCVDQGKEGRSETRAAYFEPVAPVEGDEDYIPFLPLTDQAPLKPPPLGVSCFCGIGGNVLNIFLKVCPGLP